MSFTCDTISVDCDACFVINASECAPINIDPGLVPATVYWLHITDKFFTTYKQQVTINPDGSFDINLTGLTGRNTKYSGDWQLFLSTDEAGTIVVPVTFAGTSYQCMIVRFV